MIWDGKIKTNDFQQLQESSAKIMKLPLKKKLPINESNDEKPTGAVEIYGIAKAEYIKQCLKNAIGHARKQNASIAKGVHRLHVRWALQAGKSVPAEVLADYLDIVAKYNNKSISESKSAWSIPAKLKKLRYKITDPSDFLNWKAPIALNNSQTKPLEIGELQGCLYVLIQIDGNGVIPVPRNDEHRVGYELLNHFQEKYGVIGDWVSICAGSTTYVAHAQEDYITQLKAAFTKWLSYGGVVSEIDGYSADHQGTMTSTQFIKTDSQSIKAMSKELSETGSEVVSQLLELTKLDLQIIKNPMRNDKMKNRFITLARKLYNYLVLVGYQPQSVDFNFYETAEESIFGFPSIKNTLHTQLKKYGNGNTKARDAQLLKMFGNPKIAKQELDAMNEV